LSLPGEQGEEYPLRCKLLGHFNWAKSRDYVWITMAEAQKPMAEVKIHNFLVCHGFDPENVNFRKTTRST
jgi:hypothetical protein